ncbi:ABC transporter permease subunit [Calditerrivibrio sp.]|uniref:ABC transporter permease subunit n=1 Tax=Calditerrivibrio sp. TaxID=2792612 RepID=UPI003D1078CF
MMKKNVRKKLADKIAKYLITVGGIGTILAVLLVFLFLLWTTIPLFKSGEVSQNSLAKSELSDVRHGIVDEYGLIAAVFDGEAFEIVSLPTGDVIDRMPLKFKWTSFGYNEKRNSYIFATEDGGILEVDFEFKKDNINQGVAEGKARYSVTDGRLMEKIGDQENSYYAGIKIKDLIKVQDGKKITNIDEIRNDNDNFVAYLTDDKVLHLNEVITKENILTGEISTQVNESNIDLKKVLNGRNPDYLKINSSKTTVMIFFKDGEYISIDTKIFESPKILENKKIFSDGRKITYLDFLIGRNTILVGDDKGYVTAWWPIEDQLNKNNLVFSQIYSFYSGDDSPVRFISPSKRDKSFVILNEKGRVSMYHMTSGKHLVDIVSNLTKPKIALLNQKNNKIAIFGNKGDKIETYDLKIPHPEITFRSVFGKIQYELTSKPEYVWQSSSGSDDFEPKFSLIPLIFGTIKATIVAMLFAIPVAIMSAIYTSEFASKKIRNSIKSTIEIMASLPSVVLGFIAALIVSPFVENVVLATIFSFIMIPFSLIFMGHLVQLLPKELLNSMGKYRIWIILLVALPLGLYLGVIISSFVEKLLFYGDFKYWLHNYNYSPLGGWALILLPFGVGITIYLYRRFLYEFYESLLENKSYHQAGVFELVKFFVLTICSVIITFFVAFLITKAGIDLRYDLPIIESIMNTYVQRNALIVGFIMGFAVIPIIYTVSEDALNAVPEHLRSASLAAGATQWQTVVNIILPVAMSGIFSAIMIGFGRAIGETMIVLMAAGNTPIIDMNIFSGFRTLSANIAVELPEAVINSTHYSVLYLAALVLFLMTFIINTFAEMIRIKYRKKSSQL